ncbi:single-stranded-DNA-specific exonuclease RecJ [Candidatus Albibeggiatoa sp. nov. NOAA]|uniref:single-stranded-DNA-specific exonuclease RecJ n=1 Tax=Candidatus Albibeggiatoa sp. nov. NOAA TaxID=3162724 RepID=UPI0033019E24|nr:single-stranded-DNA-specific exonuclease RecJ [Thiotrichaceae bacterium]
MKRIIRHTDTEQHQLPSHLHPVTQRVLASRQIQQAQDLDYSLKHLLPYHSLTGIQQTVNLLYEALYYQHKILIVADYDADGATSCALAVKALQAMGAKNVSFLVPNREIHGYGLSPDIVELAQPQQPDLLITVDNGIVSFRGVEAAQQCGMKVLITDHHMPADSLPNANAIVNPNQPQDSFDSKNLAGVGVIFYVMSALRSFLRQHHWFEYHQIPEFNPTSVLDLVALGTVADVVVLDKNNRILVEQGLRRIRADQCSVGIRALVKASACNQAQISTSDLGFRVAPRLNAAGRMDDMTYGINCLLCEDDETAKQYAENLSHFNEERRYVESEMELEAADKLAELSQQDLPYGLCLLEPHWHQGVIGLLASRIKDKFNRPTIVFTSAVNDELRGSARSVRGVHIKDVLERIAAQYPDMLSKFGGHAMAAGLSMPSQYYEQFSQAFDTEVRQLLTEDDLLGEVYSDGELQALDFTLTLAEQLRHVVPWGQGCVEPLFDGEFQVQEWFVLKEKHLKMTVSPITDSSVELEAIVFNISKKGIEIKDWAHSADTKKLHLVYKLDVNQFRGKKRLQLLIEEIEIL